MLWGPQGHRALGGVHAAGWVSWWATALPGSQLGWPWGGPGEDWGRERRQLHLPALQQSH